MDLSILTHCIDTYMLIIYRPLPIHTYIHIHPIYMYLAPYFYTMF